MPEVQESPQGHPGVPAAAKTRPSGRTLRLWRGRARSRRHRQKVGPWEEIQASTSVTGIGQGQAVLVNAVEVHPQVIAHPSSRYFLLPLSSMGTLMETCRRAGFGTGAEKHATRRSIVLSARSGRTTSKCGRALVASSANCQHQGGSVPRGGPEAQVSWPKLSPLTPIVQVFYCLSVILMVLYILLGQRAFFVGHESTTPRS